MPILSFIGYTLTELFRKPNNGRQIYKQTSSTFYTSSMCLKRVEKKKILGRRNNYICKITIRIYLKKLKKVLKNIIIKTN